jgi:tetratricopeptide (TPR) repeat protein
MIAHLVGDANDQAEFRRIIRSTERLDATDPPTLRIEPLPCQLRGSGSDFHNVRNRTEQRANTLLHRTGADAIVWGEVIDNGRQLEISILHPRGQSRADYDVDGATLATGFGDQIGAVLTGRVMDTLMQVQGRNGNYTVPLMIEITNIIGPLLRTRPAYLTADNLVDLRRAHASALYALGTQRGSNEDLLQAIDILYEILGSSERSDNPVQWATTQNNLSNALATLGERQAGTAWLEKAVTASSNALEEFTRDSNPLEWAATQNNLGTALATLGEREADTGRLEQAVAAYRAALEENTRDRAPLKWGGTQSNLGSVLAILGEREAGTDRLHEAVAAYRAALEELTRDRVPLDWAMTQMNLGNVLWTLGEREAGTDRLHEAVTAYRAALEEWTRDRVPMQWAGTQNNLGIALRTLGEREDRTDRLHEGLNAYRAALKEWTRDRVPLDWAMAQGNIAILHLAFFDKTGDAAQLDAAQAALDGAREVFVQAGATQYLAMAEGQQAAIDARRR